MAITVLYELPTMTQEQYDDIIRLLQRRGLTAEGRTFHVAGPRQGGGWQVLDVFESPAAFDTFVQEKLGAIIRRWVLNLRKSPSVPSITCSQAPIITSSNNTGWGLIHRPQPAIYQLLTIPASTFEKKSVYTM